MSPRISFLFCIYFILVANAKNVQREGKMFGYQYTSTMTIKQVMTSVLPSSCVQVEPSLPPCRSVRNMDAFPRFLGGRIYRSNEDIVPFAQEELLPSIHSTPLGWGEYLGLYAPTVTVTAVNMHTTTVLDPRTVVTFSVKGCKPSRLPMDLPLCSMDPIEPTSASTISSSTAVPELPAAAPVSNDLLIQSTEGTAQVDNANNEATQALTNI